MKKRIRKFGFTLMEVNLAIFIMAGGVMAMISLYPLGYRESEQSREDVKSAMMADAVLNQLEAALSSRAITWDRWKSAVDSARAKTDKGWLTYCDRKDNAYVPRKKSQLNDTAKSVFSALAGAASANRPSWPRGAEDLACALVAQWGRTPVFDAMDGSGPVVNQERDHSRVALSFRCARNAGALFSAPVYYTEIHFQGDQKDLK